jgi:hypothetical protein
METAQQLQAIRASEKLRQTIDVAKVSQQAAVGQKVTTNAVGSPAPSPKALRITSPRDGPESRKRAPQNPASGY